MKVPAKQIRPLQKNMAICIYFLALIWIIFILNLVYPFEDFRYFGIRPRNPGWLWGVILSPFLHADLKHLLANSGALFFLLLSALSFSRKLTAYATGTIVVLGGGLVWAFGTPGTVHIGASGLIFGLIGFLLGIGFFRREWSAFLISILIFLLYGGALASLLAVIPGISFSGHLFGFSGGVFAAWITRHQKKM
ncbi:rhomboid family intramembrane serine protease [Desulfobacterales bacterium HSG17]|nr:rhomboid family intramembrane serine protease [Desulfobacterales bacterium HSG17]